MPASDRLTGLIDRLPEHLATADYTRMWAAMLEAGNDDGVTFDDLLVTQGPVGLATRTHSKPERLGKTWMVHATAEWTNAHLDLPAEAAADHLGGDWYQQSGTA